MWWCCGWILPCVCYYHRHVSAGLWQGCLSLMPLYLLPSHHLDVEILKNGNVLRERVPCWNLISIYTTACVRSKNLLLKSWHNNYHYVAVRLEQNSVGIYLNWSVFFPAERHISIQTQLEGLELLVDLNGGRLFSVEWKNTQLPKHSDQTYIIIVHNNIWVCQCVFFSFLYSRAEVMSSVSWGKVQGLLQPQAATSPPESPLESLRGVWGYGRRLCGLTITSSTFVKYPFLVLFVNLSS